MTLADIIIAAGAPESGAPASMRWLAEWLPDAERRQLTRGDLARMDAVVADPHDLHHLLATVLPLARPIWIEVEITAQHGTEMIMGYGAVPVTHDRIDVGWACLDPAHGRMLGPLGPAAMTATGMQRPADINDESWRELRVAAGIVIRALLLHLGTPP